MKDRGAFCRNEAAFYDVRRATAVLNPLVRPSQPTDLAAPLGTLMRPTLTVETGDSLARGAQTLRDNGGAILPVVDEAGILQGVLTDAGLARALAEACEATDAVGGFLDLAEVLPPYSTAAEALRRGLDGRTHVVVDDARRPVGLVSALDLWPRRRMLPKPSAVGGMATPFGVYLTTGNVSAGAQWWALMMTGASMFALLICGQILSDQAVRFGVPTGYGPWLALGLFFLSMRLVPLSGIHGAEHQVVNAIEREEILSIESVRRMPLVHPRCGTNLMVGISIFLSTLFLGLGDRISSNDLELRILPAIVLGVLFAQPLGAIVQRYVTTKRPTDLQLNNAIRAGEALLRANAIQANSASHPLRKIWCMGLLQVVAGATVATSAVALIKIVTHATWLPDLTR